MNRNPNRLTYLDWTRGVAVLIMLQGHLFEAWLRPADRSGEGFWLSQFLGGLPAPIFLFLVGVSLALSLDRMRDKGSSSLELAQKVLRRGGWILFLAYAFRLEQFLVWYPASRWSDVFRVDTLNCIAVCTLLVGMYSVAFKTRKANILVLGATTAAFVIMTPFIYPLQALPPFVLSYLNGAGQSSYFSIFPWAAFTIAGMTFGYTLLEGKARFGESELYRRVAVAGVWSYAIGAGMSLSPVFEYGFFDYSLTSPHFFLVRLGWILLILYGAYRWSLRRAAERWSPLIVLGQRSLLVYWIHIEIVYGRIFSGFYKSLDMSSALKHLLWFIPLMIGIAGARELQRLLPAMASRILPVTAGSDSGK